MLGGGSGVFTVGCGKDVKDDKKLLKKIYKHEASDKHLECFTNITVSQDNLLPRAVASACTLFEQQNAVKVAVTSRIFRSVYECAKSCLSFSELSNLLILQKLNGIDVGNMLSSHHAAANIVEHIACEMRKQLVHYVLTSGSKFSIMVDESTNVSQYQSMIVYIRVLYDETPCNFFLDLIPVKVTSSVELEKALLSSLNDIGLTLQVLKRQMIGFCSDGASNMTGKHKGLATALRLKIGDHLQVFHCMAHRLELAVHNTVETLNRVSHFKIFLDSLYAF